MNGSEYLLWSYGQFEKMSFFPPDPLAVTEPMYAGLVEYDNAWF